MNALLLLSLVAGASAATRTPSNFAPVIDYPADGSVISLDGLTALNLQGHVVTTNVAPETLLCNWYVDDVLRASRAFTTAGRCDAPIPADTLLPSQHTFRLEAVQASTQRTSSTRSSASFTVSPSVVAGRDKTCGGMTGEFHIQGKANGTDGASVHIAITGQDASGAVEFMNGAIRTTTIEQTTAIACKPSPLGADCLAPFDTILQLADPAAHPGPVRWTVTVTEEVDTNGDHIADAFPTASYESTGPQDLRVVVPPALTFQEVLFGAPAAVTSTAAWGTDPAHGTYTFLARFTPTAETQAFWGNAQFVASADCVDTGASTQTLNCTRTNTGDGAGSATSEYTCSADTTLLCTSSTADYQPWSIELIATDDEGNACAADDTFELDIYSDDGLVDYDRDGTDVTTDGDCDDDDPTAWPGNPAADICDDEVDNNCDGVINDEMLDDYDAVSPNDTIDDASGPYTLSSSPVFEGSLHTSEDVDWYFLQADASEDSGSRYNVAFSVHVDISAACAAGATGDFTISMQMATESTRSGAGSTTYSSAEDGVPQDPPTDSPTAATTSIACPTTEVDLAYSGRASIERELYWWVAVENIPASADWDYAVCATTEDAAAPEATYTLTIRD